MAEITTTEILDGPTRCNCHIQTHKSGVSLLPLFIKELDLPNDKQDMLTCKFDKVASPGINQTSSDHIVLLNLCFCNWFRQLVVKLSILTVATVCLLHLTKV